MIHFDFDYFFAYAGERKPAVKGKPVVVRVYSGGEEDNGAVSKTNYVTGRYGVKSGMHKAFAKKENEKFTLRFCQSIRTFTNRSRRDGLT